MSDWKEIIDTSMDVVKVLSAALTPIIAVLGGYIAWQQYSINKKSRANQLFEIKLKFYIGVKKRFDAMKLVVLSYPTDIAKATFISTDNDNIDFNNYCTIDDAINNIGKFKIDNFIKFDEVYLFRNIIYDKEICDLIKDIEDTYMKLIIDGSFKLINDIEISKNIFESTKKNLSSYFDIKDIFIIKLEKLNNLIDGDLKKLIEKFYN